MKKCSNRLLFSLLTTLVVLLSVSCKKEYELDPDDRHYQGPRIDLYTDTLQAYELVRLQVSGVWLTEKQYEVRIGPRKVKAIPAIENNLYFMVPGGLPTGTYKIEVDLAKRGVEVIIVAPQSVPDPEAYVQALAGNPEDEVQRYLNLTGSTSAPAGLKAAESAMTQFLAEYRTLPQAEQLVIAQMLKANEEYFTKATSALEYFSGLEFTPVSEGLAYSQNCSAIQCKALKAMGDLAHTIGIMKEKTSNTMAPSGIQSFPMAMLIYKTQETLVTYNLLAALKNGLDLAYWAPEWEANIMPDALEPAFAAGIGPQSGGKLAILKGEEFKIVPQLRFRTLRASDALPESFNASIISRATTATIIEYAKYYYTTLLNSPAGPFPDYVNKTEAGKAKSLDQWELQFSGQSSGISVTAPKGATDNFYVTFNSGNKYPQPFKFYIRYNNGLEGTYNGFDATLMPQRQPATVELAAGNNQTGEAGKKLASPLHVKVKDIKGQELEGVQIEWRIKAGEGTLAAATSLTNVAGIAEMEWALGSAGTQEVEAIVNKKDGSQVSGSPVLFKAN